MFYFDGLIVVEGKNDASFLSSFICTEYVVLNGYDRQKDTLDYLLSIKNRKIIVLTDPDNAGIEIENNLRKTGLIYENRRVNIEKCNKHGKHGVAECEKDEILRVLGKDLTNVNPFCESLSKKDFCDLNLMDSQDSRDKICNIFHLGFCNSKTLFKRLNYNRITRLMIEEVYGNK